MSSGTTIGTRGSHWEKRKCLNSWRSSRICSWGRASTWTSSGKARSN
jgi:hypothetical protein